MKKKELYKIIKNIVKEQTSPKLNIDQQQLFEQADQACLSDEIRSYGEINVYANDGACTPQLVTDAFICCSSNNQNSNVAGGVQVLDTAWNYPISIPSNVSSAGCYCPTGVLGDCLG